MAERSLNVDHSTVHRWVVHFSPQLLERFNRRKRPVTGKWHLDETYIRVRGQWTCLYRAIDSVGDTVEFFFSESRDLGGKTLPAQGIETSRSAGSHYYRRQPDQSQGDHFLRC
jgi:transposase-like protein